MAESTGGGRGEEGGRGTRSRVWAPGGGAAISGSPWNRKREERGDGGACSYHHFARPPTD